MSEIAGTRNGGSIDSLLRDAGFDDDAALRDALQNLRGLAETQPEPSATVAALMIPTGSETAHCATGLTAKQAAVHPTPTRHLAAVPASVPRPHPLTEPLATEPPGTPGADQQPATDELAARRRAKRRIALTTLSVAVSLAAGGAVAVASDQGIRDSLGQVNQTVTSFVAGIGGGAAPAPVEPQAPVPAQPGGPATVPPASPAVPQPAPAAPGSASSQAPEPAPGAPGESGQGGSAPALPRPDLPVPGNLTPSLPGVPDGPPNGEGQPPALPLPPAPPVPLPGINP